MRQWFAIALIVLSCSKGSVPVDSHWVYVGLVNKVQYFELVDCLGKSYPITALHTSRSVVHILGFYQISFGARVYVTQQGDSLKVEWQGRRVVFDKFVLTKGGTDESRMPDERRSRLNGSCGVSDP